MPIINSCKYSCEPCIRGHRATSCAHTDRILIEVRKPGRPLESCGHKLDTCTCGRLAGLFTMVDRLPETTIDQLNQLSEPRFVRSDSKSSSNSGPQTPKDRIRGGPRVRKRIPKKTGLSLTQSQNLPLSLGQDQPSIQASSKSALLTPSPTPKFHFIGPSPQPASPLTVSTQPVTTPAPQDFMHYQGNQGFDKVSRSEGTYPWNYPLAPANFQSRIEDVTMAPVGLSPNLPEQHQSHIRSQYIMATQDSIWRETR